MKFHLTSVLLVALYTDLHAAVVLHVEGEISISQNIIRAHSNLLRYKSMVINGVLATVTALAPALSQLPPATCMHMEALAWQAGKSRLITPDFP